MSSRFFEGAEEPKWYRDSKRHRHTEGKANPITIEKNDNPLQLYEQMALHLQNGDHVSAVKINKQLVKIVRSDLQLMRNSLADTAMQITDNGFLRRQIWEIDSMLGLNPAYHSQAGQDKYIEEFVFKGKTGGFFIEIGGHDGITGSNTLFFEKFRNWDGICIEASPRLYEMMSMSRSVECLNIALSNFDGESAFFEITKGPHQMSGLTADLEPNVLETLKAGADFEGHEITVPVTTFEKLARERDLQKVDYFSIDVEGAEINLLQGIDFDFTDIRVMSIENPPDRKDNFKGVRKIMSDRNYRFAGSFGVDDIFVKD
jgi:FkbM family methyltransferase